MSESIPKTKIDSSSQTFSLNPDNTLINYRQPHTKLSSTLFVSPHIRNLMDSKNFHSHKISVTKPTYSNKAFLLNPYVKVYSQKNQLIDLNCKSKTGYYMMRILEKDEACLFKDALTMEIIFPFRRANQVTEFEVFITARYQGSGLTWLMKDTNSTRDFLQISLLTLREFKRIN